MATVLIADDEPEIRFLVRRLLVGEPDPWEIVGEATSGSEAIERWRELRPDVIVLDQRMPGLSGLETAALILAEHPAQAIILFIAFGNGDVCERATEVGVRACVGKSDLPRLRAAFDSLCA